MSIILLLIGGVLSGVGFITRWWQLQQALQWWYRQHVLRLFDEAEAVRNGVLQDAFTLRRTLELSSVQDCIQGTDHTELITTLGELHDSLKRFSDFLAPPYLEDSFPLAIAHLLKSHHPNAALDLAFPEHWQPNSYAQSRVVWIAIDELLRITITSVPAIQSISACLTEYPTTHKLVIKIFYSHCEAQNVQTQLKDLSYLKRSAQFLTAGICTYHFDNATLIWSIEWS